MKKIVALGLLFAGVVAVLASVAYFGDTDLEEFKDGTFERVEDLAFEDICIGRHLVSLPSDWASRRVELALNGLSVSRLGDGTPADAERLFKARRDALAAGTVKDGYAAVVLRWSDTAPGAHSLAHSLEQQPGFPEMAQTIEGWSAQDGGLFYIQGVATAPFETPKAAQALLARLRPHAGGPPPQEGSCFDGGYFAGPVQGSEFVTISMNSDTNAQSFLSLSLDLTTRGDGQASFDPQRFGDLTREYPIAGVPGGERVAIFENSLARDSGIELLATAGGTAGGLGLEVRAEINKQSAFPETPPFGPEETLTIWHQMLKSIRPTR